jgi:cytochrome P450
VQDNPQHKYVDKALEYRKDLLSTKSDSLGSGHHQQRHILLHAIAEQTDDKMELRNQIIQALMVAQEPTTAFVTNVFFLLSRHPYVWQRLRNEILALGNSMLDINTLQNLKYLGNVLNESEFLP